MRWLDRLLDRLRPPAPSPPLDEWFIVVFDAGLIDVRVTPPGREPWAASMRWDAIERVCFLAFDVGMSDDICLIPFDGRDLVIPTEANGGTALWGEIVRRGLFDAELGLRATAATRGRFCWPPDAAG